MKTKYVLYEFFVYLQPFVWLLSKLIFKNTWEGVQTTLFTVMTPDLKSGIYYADCAPGKMHPFVTDEEIGRRLWTTSWKAVGLPMNADKI